MNIVQVVVPSSPLNKSKNKYFNEIQKIEELLVSIVIIIKKIGVNHGFVFPETLEVSKKGTNNGSALQQSLTKNDTYCSGIKKVIKLSNKVLS